MPSRSELLEKIRSIDPRTKDLPDDALADALAQKYPEFANDLKKSATSFDRISELKAAAPKGEVARKAATHLRSMGVAQTAATYEQEKKDAYARAAGQAAEMLPFAAAAPFTGGLSWAGGAALMGGAGLAGGLMREGTKAIMGSSETPKSTKEIATTLGVDSLTGALAEPVGRIGTKLITGLIPTILKRSAVRHELGRDLLQKSWDTVRGKLDNLTSNHFVDVTSSYNKFKDMMDTLPKGTGKTGAALTAFKEKIGNLLNDVSADLKVGGAGTTVSQRLDALIEMKGQANAIAWDAELNRGAGRQMQRVKQFVGDLDKDIRTAIKTLPDAKEAEALFNEANAHMKILNRQSAGVIMTEKALGYMARRGALGAAIGAAGGAGYGGHKGGLRTAAIYGLEGAAAGATFGLTEAAIPRMSTWALDFMAHHPKTADDVRRAINFYIRGDEGKASALMVRAASVAEVRDAIKEVFRHPSTIAPTQTPEQMQPPATAQR